MTDERDLHDPIVDAAWRAHVRDEPAAALDRAILAAARRAVQSGPRAADHTAAPRWRAWVPLAVAATLGAIALGVVQLAGHEADSTRGVVSDAPVAPPPREAQPSPPSSASGTPSGRLADRASTSAAPASSAAAPAERRQAAPATAPLPQTLPASPPPALPASPPQAFPASPAPPPPQTLAPSRLPATELRGLAPSPPPAAGQNAAPVDRVEPALRAETVRPKVATTRTPEDFVREIERLRAQGRDADAALALAAFRGAYVDADARLPAGLRAWARGVAQP